MTELWLNFTDEEGYPKRVSVGRDSFFIGRHHDNDLFIPLDKLSRQHLRIERQGEKFTVSDCGSSNGTTLNYDELFESETLRHGDLLNLGGGVEIRVEIISARQEESFAPSGRESAPTVSENRPQATPESDPVSFGGVSSNFFFIAPALGLMILLLVGGLYLAFKGDSDGEVTREREVADSNEREATNNSRENRRTPSGDKTPSPVNAGNNSSQTPTPVNNGTTPTPVVSNEVEKVKSVATEFMKRIARNDDSPFLRIEEAEKVNQKIRNFRNSSALAENLRAVLRDKSQYETLASTKGLRPQFLAAAALNEIGNGSGNPLETAKTMLPILFNLKIPLGDNFADDTLLIIAAYNQGKKGDFKSMQSKLEGLSKSISKKKESITNREMRKIGFLRERGKLNDAEFEYALNFLAIGIIMQNPKEFGVNAEAVVF